MKASSWKMCHVGAGSPAMAFSPGRVLKACWLQVIAPAVSSTKVGCLCPWLEKRRSEGAPNLGQVASMMKSLAAFFLMCLEKIKMLSRTSRPVCPPLGFSSFYLDHFPLTAKLQVMDKAPQNLPAWHPSPSPGGLSAHVPRPGFPSVCCL